MIELDLTRDIRKVRGVTRGRGLCRYTSPCAIGAMMTREQRLSIKKAGANGYNLGMLMGGDFNGRPLLSFPAGQRGDAGRLQEAFDFPTRDFNAVLTELEAKYAPLPLDAA